MAANLGISLQDWVGTGRPLYTQELNILIDKSKSMRPLTQILPVEARAQFWRQLRDLLRERFRREQTVADLEEAIDAGETVLGLQDNPELRPSDLSILGFMKTLRFQIIPVPADIDDAIKLGLEAKQVAKVSDPTWSGIVHNLGCSLSARFQSAVCGGRVGDLDLAIECSREVMRASTPGTAAHSAALTNLNARLTLMERNTGDPGPSEEALRLSRQFLEKTPPEIKDHIIFQQNASRILLSRYERTNYWRDLEEAIRLKRLATDALVQGDEMKPISLINLATMMRMKYSTTNDRDDLREAVRLCREAVLICPVVQSVQSTRGQYLLQYVSDLSDWIRLSTEVSVIDKYLEEASEMVALMPDIFQEMILVLHCLGQIISRKYELSTSPLDFVQVVEQALSVAGNTNAYARKGLETPRYDTNVLLRLLTHVTSLAVAAQDHYIVVQMSKANHKEYCNLIRSKDFIDSLISLERDVVINIQVVAIGTRNKPKGVLRQELEDQARFATSLGAKTVQYRVKIVDITLQPNPNKGGAESSLSELSASLESLNLPGASKPMSQEKRTELLRLADKVNREARSSEELRSALSSLKTVTALPLGDDIALVHLLEVEVDLLLKSFSLTQDVDELIQAVTRMKQSIEIKRNREYSKMVTSAELRCRLLCNLTFKLRNVYLERRDEKWLADALFMATAAVEATTLVDSAPDTNGGDSFKSSALLGLANVLKSQYQLHGTFETLEKAIETIQEAIQLESQKPFTDLRQRAGYLNQLALMMRLRYMKTGEINDIDAGIQQIKNFLDAFPDDYRVIGAKAPDDICTLIHTVGLLYQTKSERTGDLMDIENAVCYCYNAMTAVGEEFSAADGRMINLANALIERYVRTDSVDDLKTATQYASKVVAQCLKQGSQRPALFLDSATIMKHNYIRTGDISALQNAGICMRKAIPLLRTTDVMAAEAFFEYGKVLELEYAENPSQETLETCISAYQSSANSIVGRATVSESAARRLYTLLVSHNRWDEAQKQMEILMERIAERCPRWLPPLDRQYLLSAVHGVPSDMTAVILQSCLPDSAESAIRSLELSRGILLGTTMDFRSEAKRLGTEHEDLAAEWNRLCMALDSSIQESVKERTATRREKVQVSLMKVIKVIRSIPEFRHFCPPLDLGSMQAYQLRMLSPELFETYNSLQREYDSFPPEKEGGRYARRQRELSDQMDAMLVKIRKLPGHEHFLLPPTKNEMITLARDGPVIIINSSEIVRRSDAIIITKAGLESIRLPLLHYGDIQNHMQLQREALAGWTLRNMAAKNKTMSTVLVWLWNCAVKPVLDHLRIKEADPRRRPRVHWIGVGILSAAPFHAAGDHSEGSTDNTISRVITSYIPTLRALSFAHEEPSSKQFQNLINNKRMLLVSVPEAPGAVPLPAVDTEIAAIADVTKPYATVVQLGAPDPNLVMQELPLAHIVHFACHAVSDVRDLNSSHLLLMQDPEKPSPPAAGKLTVQQISAYRAPSAELAYLSACSAAENQAVTLSDESIHIASAFQLVGFRHVVGTLWKARDSCCREVAADFYSTLLAMGEGDTGLRASEALDQAVMKLRRQNPGRVLSWAPFVHIGA